MKKILIFLIIFCFLDVHGYDFMYNDIYYNVISLEDETCKVTTPPTSGFYKGEINIPPTVEINNHTLTVVGVESMAFSNSIELTKIMLPSTLTFIEERAFYNCTSFQSISVSEENLFFTTLDDVLYDKDFTTLFVCPASINKEILYIPNSVVKILPYAFEGIKIKEIILSENLEEIPNGLFYASHIENLSVPSSVKMIYESAFFECEYLKHLSIEDGEQLLSFRLNDEVDLQELIMNLEYQRNYEYITNLKNIEDLYVGRNIKGWDLLPIAKSLKKATIGEKVTEIGDYAFMYCDSLETVILSNNLKTIGDGAFQYCHSLKGLNLPQTFERFGQFSFIQSGLEHMIVPDSVKVIPEGCFANTCLKDIKIGNNITKIERVAFSSCQLLESVIFNEKLDSISDRAFAHCSMLDSIVLPDSISFIGEFCFMSCVNLKAINIPSKVKEINENILSICNNISEITFDYSKDDLEIISDPAHNWVLSWPQIETLNVYRNVKFKTSEEQIYPYFIIGEKLKTINIGRTVNSIDNFFFKEINALENLNVYNNEPPYIDERGFGNNSFINTIVSIPEESIENFKDNSFWNKFWNLREDKEVSTPTENIIIEDSYSMEVLDSLKIEIEIYPKDSTYPIHLRTDNEEIASVDQNGNIFALRTGSVNLFVNSGEIEKISLIDIDKREQNIIWDQDFNGLTATDSIILNANSTSGLKINYNIIKGEDLCEIKDSVLYINDLGQIEIEATQLGDEFYKEAQPVIKGFEVQAGVFDAFKDQSVNIKIDNNWLIIKNRPKDEDVKIFTSEGRLIYYGKSDYIPINNKGIIFINIKNKYYKILNN